MNFDKRLIAERAEKLRVDFLEHMAELQRDHPEMTEDRLIFEGWVVEKIASLQLLVEQLVAERKK